MPLLEGKENIGKNIKELNESKPSAPREKAIKTYMKKHNYDYDKAKQKLSIAIAISKV